MLFISPPFGNYLNLYKTISIKGSFTLEPRDGLFSQILKTLRYSSIHGGWINKIGLRNKGIDWALLTYKNRNDVIISIALRSEDEIEKFNKKIPNNTNLEINISCPNVHKDKIEDNLGNFINDERKWCILKLSPLTTEKQIENYYKQGFRQFHCSNTLPNPRGGLSGPSLIPHTSRLIKILRDYEDVIIIAGGGIQSMETLERYKKLGANHFAISTVLFNPFKFMNFYFHYLYSYNQ
jgi:dihydroorotate dehydrogenase